MHRLVLPTVLAVGLGISQGGRAATPARADLARVRAAVDGTGAEVEPALTPITPLDAVLRIALAHNPDVQEARARVRERVERAQAAGRLPDLEFKYEQWAVPTSQPVALGRADALLMGFRQTFPAPAVLDARTRVAVEEARMTLETAHTREQEVVTQVRRAYAEFRRAEGELAVHREHVDIESGIVALARAGYQEGRGSQQEVLRTVVELSRLHADLVGIEQERTSSHALLNALMGRPADAALGRPEDLDPVALEARAAAVVPAVAEVRPEVAAAARAVDRSSAALDGARADARWPSLMVGVDYFHVPDRADPHAYGGMASINLPWLNPARRDEVRAAEHALAADELALASARNVAGFQRTDARARFDAAHALLAILDRDLLPQARRSFEAAQAGFAAGTLDGIGLHDALRSYQNVRVDRVRALARLEAALADLERAAGSAARNGGGSTTAEEGGR
ncbi:MAG: TolC family protein [Candidatus Binatia bacterium]